jgi:hypothetical protein
MRSQTPFSRIAGWWFRPKAFEKEGEFYQWVGVPIFKRLFMATVGRVGDYSLKGRGITALEDSERWTRVFETYHLIFGAIITGTAAWLFLVRGHVSLELIIAGCVLNLYLVLLQRYNRVRLLRATARMAVSKRPKKKVTQATS